MSSQAKLCVFPLASNGTAKKKMGLKLTHFKVFSLNFRVLPHSPLFIAAQDTRVRACQVLQGLQQRLQGLPKKKVKHSPRGFQVHFTGYDTLQLKSSPKREAPSFALQGVIFRTLSGTRRAWGEGWEAEEKGGLTGEEFPTLTKKTALEPKPETSHTAEWALPRGTQQ